MTLKGSSKKEPTKASAIKTSKKQPTETGFVEDTKTYTINGLCAAIGVEERTVRESRSSGLPTRLIGGRRLVISGAEFNEWVRNNAPLAPTPKGKTD